MYVLRGPAICGRSSAKRIVPRLSSGKTLYLPASDVPERDHLDQLRRGSDSARFVGLGRVLGDVVELPVLGVELAQLVFGSVSAPKHDARLRERRARATDTPRASRRDRSSGARTSRNIA